MENIHDPHNVSAMFRSADAVGIHEVHLIYTTEKFPKIGSKSSSSANKWIERKKHPSADECFNYLRKNNYQILATKLDEDAKQLYEFDLTKPTAFVFGNEHAGVSDDAAHSADATVYIPMMGMIQSLNVSVACAVTIYEALRQRMNAGLYSSPRFDENTFLKLQEEWLKK